MTFKQNSGKMLCKSNIGLFFKCLKDGNTKTFACSKCVLIFAGKRSRHYKHSCRALIDFVFCLPFQPKGEAFKEKGLDTKLN